MPGENGSLAIHERDRRVLSRQRLRTGLHGLFEIQRCEQHELRLARFAPRGVGDLQHRDPGQPAEDRLHGERVLRVECVLEIPAIRKLQRPAGAQRIAKQLAIRLDREYSGVLRMFLEHIGQEGGAGRPVLRVEIPRPGQSVMQLRRGPDRIFEILRDLSRRRGQILPRGGDLGVATFEKLHPGHQRGDERGEQDQEQKPGADAQRSASGRERSAGIVGVSRRKREASAAVICGNEY
jgi:hypothetical protein